MTVPHPPSGTTPATFDTWATQVADEVNDHTDELAGLPGTYGAAATHLSGNLGDRPAATAENAGFLFFAQDVNGGTLYRSNGSSWVPIAPGLAVEQVFVKSADQVVNNSTTNVDDNHFAIPIAANTSYIVDGLLIYDASTAADIKFTFQGPSGATFDWGGRAAALGVASNIGETNHQQRGLTQPLWAGGGGVGTLMVASPLGRLVVASTAGTLLLRWAQRAADATDTTLRAGSWLRLRTI
jgi:hypothetical protein